MKTRYQVGCVDLLVPRSAFGRGEKCARLKLRFIAVSARGANLLA